MLASAGQTVQMTNKELRNVRNGISPLARDTDRDAAISRALLNQKEAYAMLEEIK
jgi:hypothetical protein